MLKFIYTFLLVILAGAGVAQEGRRYNFTHYTAESGLISYQVNTCAQDELGYIWIGTNDGLQRYDGIRYKAFRHRSSEPASIPSKGIWQILFDRHDNMWIMTADGKVGIFNRNSFTFQPAVVKVKNESFLQATLLNKKLVTDEYGNVFLLLPGKEFVTYNKEKNEFSAAHNFINVNQGLKITELVQQPGTRKYWMCTEDSGIIVYNQETKQLSSTTLNTAHEKLLEHFTPETKLYKIFFDRQGRAWLAGLSAEYPYVYCYDTKRDEVVIEKYEFEKGLQSYYEVNEFMQQRDGSVWVIGVKVFAKFLEKERKFEQVYNGYVDDRSIEFIKITCLVEDKEQNMWAATANNGLFCFSPSKEFFTNTIHNNPATGKYSDSAPVTFMEDSDGTILCGIWDEAMLRYDHDLNPVPLDITGFKDNKVPPVLEISETRDGKFAWMATRDALYKYDKAAKKVQYYDASIFLSRIREIEEDKNGNLWIGTQADGVFKWDAVKGAGVFKDGIKKIEAIPSVRVNKILVDKEGYVWVGTFAEGAYMLDAVTGKVQVHFHQKDPGAMKLPEQTVHSILEYSDSTMIIATGANLLSYNRVLRKLSSIITSESISGYVASLEKDKEGYLWMGTTTALYRIAVRSRVLARFNRLSGIRNDYFIFNAAYKLKDGRILMGTTATMLSFNPPAVKIDNGSPEIHITDFKVMNQSVRLDSLLQLGAIKFGANENSIIIDLSTLSYHTVYMLQYKLEGLDADWRQADKSMELVYSYLPAGKYTLLVNAITSDGKPGTHPLRLAFQVLPPYWKSWWFYSILFLIIGGLFFWLDKERMKRKATLQKMRSNIAGNLHEEVSTALNNINVLSEMARLKADKEPQKSKEFIEQIHSKSSTMIDSMDDMLWAISPDNDSMQKTVERMQEYTDGLNNQVGSHFELLVDEKVKSLKLDMQFRHEAYLLFKESIQRLLKAGADDCKIYANMDKNILVFTIQCKNQSCNIQQLNNLLHSQVMQKRLDAIKAVMQTEIHKSHSIFTLKVPL
ncbi:MAG: two-component regulator propeller domain-containing protein [Ferruginibacter sp.]